MGEPVYNDRKNAGLSIHQPDGDVTVTGYYGEFHAIRRTALSFWTDYWFVAGSPGGSNVDNADQKTRDEVAAILVRLTNIKHDELPLVYEDDVLQFKLIP